MEACAQIYTHPAVPLCLKDYSYVRDRRQFSLFDSERVISQKNVATVSTGPVLQVPSLVPVMEHNFLPKFLEEGQRMSHEFVFTPSTFDGTNETECKGIDWDAEEVPLDSFAKSFFSTGFQATNVALAIDEISRMLNFRLSHRSLTDTDYGEMRDLSVREKVKCTIFLTYTSNMITTLLLCLSDLIF